MFLSLPSDVTRRKDSAKVPPKKTDGDLCRVIDQSINNGHAPTLFLNLNPNPNLFLPLYSTHRLASGRSLWLDPTIIPSFHVNTTSSGPPLMRLHSGGFAFGRATWTCAQCKNSRTPASKIRRAYSSYGRPVKVVRPRQAVYWAAAGGALGGSLLFFTDDIKHGWHAAARTGRVVSTLAVNINEYEHRGW